jgi:pterin-4a-carbinolamine dehydratase
MFKPKDWSQRRGARSAHRDRGKRPGAPAGWKLSGDGADVAIEKTFTFANYFETIAFVNALAFVAHRAGPPPDLSVHYNRCVVRFNTHDVQRHLGDRLRVRAPGRRAAGAHEGIRPWLSRRGWFRGSHRRHRSRPGRRQPWPPLPGGNAGRRTPHLPPARQEEPGRGRRPRAAGGQRRRRHDREVEPRRNLFYRQDEIRTKSFAANLDQVLILIAAEPEFSEHQLARALIAAEAERIAPIIALNKSDLVEPFERAWAGCCPTSTCTTACCRCRCGLGRGRPRNAAEAPGGKTTLVLGPSGAGKSTLINLLVPGAGADRRDLAGAQFRQAHDHQHDLVLGRRRAHHGAHRFARLPGIRPAPHRADAAGRPDARHAPTCERLQVLQLHAPARAGLRRDRHQKRY